MFHGSSSNPQIVAIECNNTIAKGNGERLKSKLTMLTRLLHDLKLIREDGSPTTEAQNAIINMNAAHAIGLMPEPRGTAKNGMESAITTPLLNMPVASATFPNSGILRNDLNMETNVLIRLTKKAEPPPTRGVNRDSGTDSANGGWLRRLVRQTAHTHFVIGTVTWLPSGSIQTTETGCELTNAGS